MLSESDLPAMLDTFVPEEVWDKFQLDLDLTSAFGNIESSFDMYYSDCLLHHDCMWTGLCDDKEHKFDEPRSCNNNNNHNIVEDIKPPVTITTTSSTTKQQVFQPQQSLLKPRSVNPNTVLPMNKNMTTITGITTTTTPTTMRIDINNLQTPPMSDDDDETKPIMPKALTHVDDAIFESMLDDDLMKYIKGEDDVEFEGLLKSIKEEKPDDVEDEFEDLDFIDEVAEESDDDDDDDDYEENNQNNTNNNEDNLNMLQDDHTIQMRAYRAAASDHSYHKGTINLGIDTPSDSEEEIDVVSISKNTGALPTNPSPKDRHHLQRTMQNRFPQGIKTILPTASTTTTNPTPQTRRDISTTISPSPTKRKVVDNNSSNHTTNRGRNSKQYKKYHQTHKQYRRRHGYGHSSDSEPEPSEKRSLHNNMERQRRIDLRNLFEDLKVLVPEVNKKQRAAKVLILRGAAAYCRSLTNTSVELKKKSDDLKKRQENLLLKVSLLRRNLAANR